MDIGSKIKKLDEVAEIAERLRNRGEKIVTTNGCFDIFTAGHAFFLQEAKKQGDALIVGVNTDNGVKAWKKHIGREDWEKRPFNRQDERAMVIASQQSVDYVFLFDELTPNEFLEKIRPDVHVNGSEYGENCIEAETVKKYGKLVLIPNYGGISTSKLIGKIAESMGAKDKG